MYPPSLFRDGLRSVLEPEPQPSLPPDTRLAAVLVPVLLAPPRPRLVFTRRTEFLPRHPGEISFPGGLVDDGESVAHAALREAEEELGITADAVELIGGLPPVHTYVSSILIYPMVGVLAQDPLLTPNAGEIADVLEFPLADLVSVEAEREFEREGTRFRMFVYELGGHLIWGATAFVLRSFIEALGEAAATAAG